MLNTDHPEFYAAVVRSLSNNDDYDSPLRQAQGTRRS